MPEPTPYLCPGETQPITRAIHLGRLAAFYPACRECAWRTDSAGLPPRLIEQLAETFLHIPAASLLFDEGLVGTEPADIHSNFVRQVSAAFGQTLLAQQRTASAVAPVLVAGDGRPVTSELIAAAAEGICREGLAVIEIGPATAGSFTHALSTLGARGGVLLGNARGLRREVSLKFWGARGEPWSQGPELEALETARLAGAPRSSRSSGPLGRAAIDADYLATLAPYFHALRPLRVQIECSSHPWWQHLERASAQVACQFAPVSNLPTTSSTGQLAAGYDFALWIDGDGETLHLWDERGHAVPPEKLFLLLTEHLLRDKQSGAVLWASAGGSESLSKSALNHLKRRGVTPHSAASSRQATYHAWQQDQPLLGGGASGRYWLSAGGPTADALRVLALLLVILSESDEALSQRITAVEK